MVRRLYGILLYNRYRLSFLEFSSVNSKIATLKAHRLYQYWPQWIYASGSVNAYNVAHWLFFFKKWLYT